MKKSLYLLYITAPLFSMELDLVKFTKPIKRMRIEQPSSLFVPERLGPLELYYGAKEFSVKQDNKTYHVKKYFTDKILYNMTKKELTSFLEDGYLSLNQMDDGEFSLKAKGRVKGGGPIFGSFMYWLTKSLCYGVLTASTSSVVVATGGAVIGAVSQAVVYGAQLGIATTAAGTAVGSTIIAAVPTAVTGTAITAGAAGTTTLITVTGTTAAGAAVGTTSGFMGAAIVGAGYTTEATLVTSAAVSSVGSFVAITAGIETLSIGVGTVCG